jgi:flagella basal body P-ring formation protein FlgA
MKTLLLLAGLLLASPAGADTGVRIVVPAHTIARGEIISDADLAYQTIPSGSFMPGMTTSAQALDGMQARRVLRAGEGVRSEDVRAPILVTRGQTVTMTFTAPGITLTAVGRAMSAGGKGETVTVQNPASYRMISATVIGPGAVRTTGSLNIAAQAMRAGDQTARN